MMATAKFNPTPAKRATVEKAVCSNREGLFSFIGSCPDRLVNKGRQALAALQTQVKSVEETYGIDNLHLTVARGYVAKLLANNRVVRWLATHQQDYLSEFQKIAEIDTLGPIAETPSA